MPSPISVALFLSALLMAGASHAVPLASEKNWIVREEDYAGSISCSIEWEPLDTPLRVSIQYLFGDYLAWFPELPDQYVGERTNVYFDSLEGLGRSAFNTDWDNENQSHVSNLDRVNGKQILSELISGDMGPRKFIISSGIKTDTVYESVPFDDARLVGQEMLDCIARSQQMEIKAALSSLDTYDGVDPKEFVRLYRKQIQNDPDELVKRKMDLGFGYAYYITASKCRNNLWAIDDHQLGEFKSAVDNIIAAKGIDEKLKNHVWKYINYALQVEKTELKYSECENIYRLARMQMPEFYTPKVIDIPNPF